MKYAGHVAIKFPLLAIGLHLDLIYGILCSFPLVYTVYIGHAVQLELNKSYNTCIQGTCNVISVPTSLEKSNSCLKKLQEIYKKFLMKNLRIASL